MGVTARPGRQAGRRFPGMAPARKAMVRNLRVGRKAMVRSPHVARRVMARKARAHMVPGPKAKGRGLPARKLRGRVPLRLPEDGHRVASLRPAVLRTLRMFRPRAARLRPPGLLPPRLRLVRAGRPRAALLRRHVHRRVRKDRLRTAACRLPVAPSVALPRRGPRRIIRRPCTGPKAAMAIAGAAGMAAATNGIDE